MSASGAKMESPVANHNSCQDKLEKLEKIPKKKKKSF